MEGLTPAMAVIEKMFQLHCSSQCQPRFNLSLKLQMNFQVNIERKEPRLFVDVVPSQKTGYQKYLKVQLVFLWKYICALWANVAQVIFSSSILSQAYLDSTDLIKFLCNVVPAWWAQHCIGYLPQKSCLIIIQHSTGNFVMQSWPR